MLTETLIIFLTSVMSLNGISEKEKKALEIKETLADKKHIEHIQPSSVNLKNGGWDYN